MTAKISKADRGRCSDVRMSGLRARRTATAVGAPLATLMVTILLASPADASTSPAAMITAVRLLDSHTNQPSRKQEALLVSPAPGDVLALAIETKFPGTAAFTAAGVNGGGVATWTKASAYLTRDAFHGQELWWGVVTQPGANTITVDYTTASTSASPTSATSVSVQEFAASSGPSTTWSVDETGQADTGEKSTAPTYPTLVPTAKSEAYFGYLAVPNSIAAGPTPGVVYQTDARGNQNAYAASVSSSITPQASVARAQPFSSIGMLLRATT